MNEFQSFRRWTRAGVLVVVAVIVVGILAGVWGTHSARSKATPGVVPGYVVDGIPGIVDDADRHGTVKLPVGDLEISAAKPVQKESDVSVPPPGKDDDSSDQTSAGSNRIVQVEWELSGSGPAIEAGGPAYQFHVTLVSDGHRYALPVGSEDLDPPYETLSRQASWYVVVAGKGERLKAEVEYDGQVQTLDLSSGKVDAGRATYLYDKSEQKPRSYPCRLLTRRQLLRYGTDAATCSIEVGPPVPYLAGLGWADPGEAWTVVDLDFRSYGFVGPGRGGSLREFRTVPGKLAVRVDGRARTRLLSRYQSAFRFDGSLSATYVFRTSTAPKTLSVRLPYTARAYGGHRSFRFGIDRDYRLR